MAKKRLNAPRKPLKLRVKSHKLSLNVGKPGKALSELLGVYDDLEQTLKRLRARSLLQVENSLMQINVKELINQLSKSKRTIERKITEALINDRSPLAHRIDKWAPRLGSKISQKTKASSSRDAL